MKEAWLSADKVVKYAVVVLLVVAAVVVDDVEASVRTIAGFCVLFTEAG